MDHPPDWDHADIPHRRCPAEFAPGLGWYQEGYRQRTMKPHYHFVWPKDGKNGSTWGRWKDILTGKGPDIHLTISADRKDYMANRPESSRWTRHTNLDDRGPDGALRPREGIRRKREGLAYDFKTRRYRRPYRDMWTEAVWQPEPNSHTQYPEALRDIYGIWYQDFSFVPSC